MAALRHLAMIARPALEPRQSALQTQQL